MQLVQYKQLQIIFCYLALKSAIDGPERVLYLKVLPQLPLPRLLNDLSWPHPVVFSAIICLLNHTFAHRSYEVVFIDHADAQSVHICKQAVLGRLRELDYFIQIFAKLGYRKESIPVSVEQVKQLILEHLLLFQLGPQLPQHTVDLALWSGNCGKKGLLVSLARHRARLGEAHRLARHRAGHRLGQFLVDLIELVVSLQKGDDIRLAYESVLVDIHFLAVKVQIIWWCPVE